VGTMNLLLKISIKKFGLGVTALFGDRHVKRKI
jgi:hypothetical protein